MMLVLWSEQAKSYLNILGIHLRVLAGRSIAGTCGRGRCHGQREVSEGDETATRITMYTNPNAGTSGCRPCSSRQ